VTQHVSRRQILQESAAFGVLALGGVACSKQQPPPLSCTDATGLSAAEMMVRTSLGYVDRSPDEKKDCKACAQFVPAQAAATCGTCRVVKGPINPEGYCKSFVAKAT
jgi:hypothetical protein